MPIVATSTPSDCFDTAIEAVRIAIRHTIPVMLLSDGYLANGAEPWKIPDSKAMEPIEVNFRTDPEGFQPYGRDENLARPWAIPGTPHLEHRLGGLEKQDLTGNVSYDPENHQHMTNLRAAKVAKVADHIPPTEIFGADRGAVLVLSWGSTYGACHAAVDHLQARGESIGHVHLRHLSPFPNDLGEILSRYKTVVMPELNMGQLALIVRARYLVDVKSICKVQGKPFKEAELIRGFMEHLEASK
jgi:2-oxoglutarate ferredoxin oxidoreductase subunit alpha